MFENMCACNRCLQQFQQTSHSADWLSVGPEPKLISGLLNSCQVPKCEHPRLDRSWFNSQDLSYYIPLCYDCTATLAYTFQQRRALIQGLRAEPCVRQGVANFITLLQHKLQSYRGITLSAPHLFSLKEMQQICKAAYAATCRTKDLRADPRMLQRIDGLTPSDLVSREDTPLFEVREILCQFDDLEDVIGRMLAVIKD